MRKRRRATLINRIDRQRLENGQKSSWAAVKTVDYRAAVGNGGVEKQVGKVGSSEDACAGNRPRESGRNPRNNAKTWGKKRSVAAVLSARDREILENVPPHY
ncbi:MAG: hypothetical protein Q4A71_08315 [Actinomycetaceae bacterium]|nr:hypothetical protein [Actinomycetaceae bacterium]